MGKAFHRPQALAEVVTHFCPGCTLGVAHRLVAETVKRLPGVEASHEEIVESLMTVAKETLGRKLRTTRGHLIEALCPMNFIAVRNRLGGPAPEQVSDFLARQRATATADKRWLKEKTSLLRKYPEKLGVESQKI